MSFNWQLQNLSAEMCEIQNGKINIFLPRTEKLYVRIKEKDL